MLRTPIAAQACLSFEAMRRDAAAMSGAAVPAQKAWNPSVVLLDSTDGVANGPDFAK
jgi:hypothetical protein